MDAAWALAGLLLGVVLGTVSCWLVLKARFTASEADRSRLEQEKAQMASEKAKVEADLREAELDRATYAERAARITDLEAQIDELQRLRDSLRNQLKEYETNLAVQVAEIAKEREALKEQAAIVHREKLEQKALLDEAQIKLKEAFTSLSAEALQKTNEQFLQQADQLLKLYKETAEGDTAERKKALSALVEPIQERLKELDKQNQEMERTRTGAYAGLREQIDALLGEQKTLRGETGKLIRALQDPGSAGQWGEMVLERVIEMAGLNEHVDFVQQQTQGEPDQRQRPDCTVRMSGGRTLFIDSKVPMRSYLDALNEPNPNLAQSLLQTHATKMLEHARELRRRKYHDVQEAADFTVMFISSEAAFRAAMEARPSLMEEAMECNVVIATPSTLLALLRSVAYGWRQERLAKSAQKLQDEGKKLYESVCKLFEHYDKLGKALASAGKAYNDFGGSLNSRVLPAGRRLKDLGVDSGENLPEVSTLEFAPKALTAQEVARSLEANGQASLLAEDCPEP